MPSTSAEPGSATENKLREYLRRAIADARDLRERLRRTEDRVREPIAVTGMACRFPGGVATPDDLWRMVADGVDAIGPFPRDRGWPLEDLYEAAGGASSSVTLEGGFLDDPAGFDAEFFGISPREALTMDPQQRLLLEVSWEAVERAGIDPHSLRGSRTGVFLGGGTEDFAGLIARSRDAEETSSLTGTTSSVMSGRVAYTLGLEGPALTVDTACSSSLVTLHLAVQALRTGECDLALAGGVAVMSTPGIFPEFARQGGLASDGRCKAFADSADGTGWGEGVGVLMVERLSDARRHGRPVLAVIRGSAVNQDGASNGLTAPNGPSQQRVIRDALVNAGLSPTDVDAVEAHGTGTQLGDPIEAQALLATYGQGRPQDRPLWVGSVKSNIGHTVAAAGVGGVIKTVMALRHGVLPRTLHVAKPTRQVDWSAGAVEVLTEARQWPETGRPRRAGVSSFGISGTNAHIVLEQGDGTPGTTVGTSVDTTADGSQSTGPVPWLLSARGETALRSQAAKLLIGLENHPDVRPQDVGFSSAVSRAALEHRAVVVGSDREELLRGVAAVAAGRSDAGVVRGRAGGGPGPVFVFPGQGSQWAGMAVELLESSPVFAARMAECEEALSSFVDWSLAEVLCGGGELVQVDVVQPVLWAVMVSLAEVWRSYGVEPAAVVGHSQGEIAAAVVAGALSLEDGARVVALRSKAILALSGRGGMASVRLPVDEVRTLSPLVDGRVEVAAVNGPSSVVVAGTPDGLDQVVAEAEARGARARRIAVDYASHSAQVEEIRDELAGLLRPVEPAASRVAFHSCVTGGPVDTAGLDGAYWFRNLRQPVLFEQVTRALLEQGHGLFVEVSPHAVLTGAVRETAEEVGREVAVTGTLRRGEGGRERLLLSLGEAYVHGAPVDWQACFAGTGARRVDLPTYAFQHRRYWTEMPAARFGDAALAGLGRVDHPLLGAVVEPADGDRTVFTGRLSPREHPWTADHVVHGTVMLPGTAFLELALWVGERMGTPRVDELVLAAPLLLSESEPVRLQIVVDDADEDGRHAVRFFSRTESGGEEWTRHGSAVLGGSPQPEFELGVWPPAGAEPVELDGLYEKMATAGFGYGPAFRGLRAAWRRGDEVFTEVGTDPVDTRGDGFVAHPALLDAALHGVSLLSGTLDGGARLPFSWSGVTAYAAGAASLRVRLAPTGGDGLSLYAVDALGAPVLAVDELAFRPVSPDRLAAAAPARPDGLLRVEWPELPVRVTSAGTYVQLGDQGFGDVAELDAALAGDGPKPSAVVARCPVTAADAPAEAAGRATIWGLDLLRDWLAADRPTEPPLVIVTRGAAPLPGTPPTATGTAHAALVGLLRSAQTEEPGRIILVDEAPDDRPAPSPLSGVLTVPLTSTDGVPVPVQSVGGLPVPVRSADGPPAAVSSVEGVAVPVASSGGDFVPVPSAGGVAVPVASSGGESVPVPSVRGVAVPVASAGGASVPVSSAGGVPVPVSVIGCALTSARLDAVLASGEAEVAVRGDRVYGRRLVRGGGESDGLRPPAGGAGWRLDVTEPGSFGNLALVPDEAGSAELGEGQVRVAVRAAGLNFRDTLIALGMYPDRARLGSEGCGVVTEVGPGVTWPAPGDRVMGTLDTPFAPLSVADARLLAPVPVGWTDAQGASATVAFLTAYYGLVDLGGLRAGQRVLIHAAAGGVGSAAVQLARRLGAEVYATASRPKWDALRAAGLDDAHLADSRTLEFRDAFLTATDGRGMDVVLNCLAGEFTDASLHLLPRGGRFVEMGKTDPRDPRRVAAEHPGVGYRPFDLADAGPERIQEILRELATLFADGTLTPPPATTWDVHHAPRAFRALAQATLVGKAVLTLPPAGFAPDETVLVTGGTGTLGALVARRLVTHHAARHLLLLSRSGPRTPEAQALRDELVTAGARVEIVAGDIADDDAVQRLHDVLARLRVRLGGIVHCAGTTDDGALGSLTADRLTPVLRPKTHGAWNLHRLTELHPEIRQFVLFSSAAATVGSPGQANYAAANAFLDALAHHRRARGLPALSIGWGLWERGSALTAHLDATDHRRLRSGGFRALPTEEALALFDETLSGRTPDPAVVAAPVDGAALRARHAREPLPALFQPLLGPSATRTRRRTAAQETHEPGAVLRRRLAAMPEERRTSTLLAMVRGEVAAVLGHAGAGLVDTDRSFREMGFDSLTAVELRNRLNAATGLRLPATLVFDHPRLDALAAHVSAELAPGGTPTATATAGVEQEAEIRSLIMSVPLARLRESGLLDPLLALAGGGTAPPQAAVRAAPDQSDEIRSMDAAALVEMARSLSTGSDVDGELTRNHTSQ
ncbi:SDR family NAD(P)-dependent oxidoreductase [Streptomyces sp. NPDC012510]|uniref:SDR family NAD(P)-dependent oxidoreductase n=1 Tax=Streptomyces sp. NPDC012510 TaxID=3364838 RepID=UPI0036E76DE1